ncbi:MAG: flagellar basal body P-ring formation chaperone FlgA [Bacteriovoracaceae bacterium]|nr:flagellar basal body P-ring formation chaperone FlgA [Bacteriovoracaceae bacterium]
MLKILVFINLFLSSSMACEVRGPKLILWDKSKTGSRPAAALSFKNCNDKDIEKIQSFTSDFEGTLSSRIFQSETGIKVSMTNIIKIDSLESFLNDRVDKNREWRFINTSLVGTNESIVTVNEGQSINVDCSLCKNTGEKNVKIELRDPIKGSYKAFWSKGDLAAKTTALVCLDNLNVNNQPLSPRFFREKITYSTRPDQFFTSAPQTVFYKLNKAKVKGEAIHFQDLTPVNLVKMGNPVTVILRNESLSLEGSAIPGQSGRLGERIRLKNVRTQKTIIGKVIDFNKVEVEL